MPNTPNSPVTMRDTVSLEMIFKASQGTLHVARMMDGTVFYGTARSIGNRTGGFIRADEDVRGAFLRVTLNTGFETYWPVSELMDEVHSGFFVAPYQI